MALPITLPISRLIDVNVTLTQSAAQGQNLNALLILGTSTVIDVVTRIRSYTSLAQVATDFGTSAPEYLAAVLWFEQSPQPTQLYIGRWAKTASSGQLIGGPLTAAQQLISNWTAITSGAFHITVDGGGAQSVTGLNFSAVTNMNGVASIIQAGVTGCTVVWNPTYTRFQITSVSTGTSSSISFLTAGSVDISAMMECQSTSSGAYQANGIAAESAVSAVTLFDTNYGQQWFAITVIGTADSDTEAIAPYIEGATNFHYFGVTTQESTVLTPGDTSDIAYALQQLDYNRTGVQYSSTNPYAVVSLLGRILTTNYAGNSTVISLMYQQEPGITPENLNSTQIAALESKNCNVFVAYNNNTAIIEQGVSSSGQFIDTVIGALALSVEVQTAIYNLLYTSTTKIPQTDAGMHQIVTAISQVLTQFVTNGWLAPGEWNGASVGSISTGQTLDNGFYVYVPPVATQSQANRTARISVPIQVIAKLAGAVQTVNVSITVNP